MKYHKLWYAMAQLSDRHTPIGFNERDKEEDLYEVSFIGKVTKRWFWTEYKKELKKIYPHLEFVIEVVDWKHDYDQVFGVDTWITHILFNLHTKVAGQRPAFQNRTPTHIPEFVESLKISNGFQKWIWWMPEYKSKAFDKENVDVLVREAGTFVREWWSREQYEDAENRWDEPTLPIHNTEVQIFFCPDVNTGLEVIEEILCILGQDVRFFRHEQYVRFQVPFEGWIMQVSLKKSETSMPNRNAVLDLELKKRPNGELVHFRKCVNLVSAVTSMYNKMGIID